MGIDLYEHNQKAYEAALSMMEKSGKAAVIHATEDGYHLGAWITNMRQKRYGKKAILTEDRIKRLDEIGMAWDKKHKTTWERNYAAAREYFKEHGNLDVPATYKTKDGMTLGKWIYNQRESKGLSVRNKKRLSEIGMIWQKEDPWEVRYRLAKGFYEQHGHLNMSQTYKTENGIWLGKWLALQCRIRNGAVKKGEINPSVLTKERIERLDQIGMVWDKVAPTSEKSNVMDESTGDTRMAV